MQERHGAQGVKVAPASTHVLNMRTMANHLKWVLTCKLPLQQWRCY